MNSIRRNLKRAREAEPMSRERYSWESWALGTLKGMVSYWADTSMMRGKREENEWAKEVLQRVKELDRIFKEDKDAKK
jgi:hypothetical protein